jgi:hypothetical protein
MTARIKTDNSGVVAYWMRAVQKLRYELRPGHALPRPAISAEAVAELSDEQVFSTEPVSGLIDPAVIALVMAAVKPKQRPGLKSEIEALRTLAHRQQAVWAQRLKGYEAEDRMLDEALAALESGNAEAAAEIAQALTRDLAAPHMTVAEVNAWRDEQAAAIDEFLKNGSLNKNNHHGY